MSLTNPSTTALATLIDVVTARAQETPGRALYTFLADGQTESDRLTFGELDQRVRAVAATLQSLGLAGERALLLYPPGLDFITAFLGCIYAGVAAVPAYPPRRHRSHPSLPAIVRDSGPAACLTTGAIRSRAEALCAELPELAAARWLATDDASELAAAEAWRRPPVDDDALVFLQYTSGSTAEPKGVMVSHGNLQHNLEMVERSFEQSESSIVVGWLPLYHDMGLIGDVLQPLYCGASCVLMAPVAFLQKPVRWLRAISRYRATTSGGPNFAYELCVRRVPPEDREGLDLTSWKVAFNGAEPVRPDTLERFAAAYEPWGFRRSAFHPCYGLAEGTLLVSCGAVGAAPKIGRFDSSALERNEVRLAAEEADAVPARRLASCGRPWLGQRVAIADPETGRACGAERVGEIWVAGHSVARGYWGQPETSERTFRARLAGDGAAAGRGDPFLRTGDLGFLSDGELYITGRLKDLIIIRGRNHYPQDIELTAERSHPGLRPGCGAAFSCEVEGEERLVVVQEVERHPGAPLPELAAAVRRAVAEEHEIEPHQVALIRTGHVPKTTSGKVRRRACREALMAGRLPTVLVSEAAAPVVQEVPEEIASAPEALAELPVPERRQRLLEQLRQRLAATLGKSQDEVLPDASVGRLGLDSLRAVELQVRLEEAFACPVELADLYDRSVAELADEIAGRLGTSAGPLPVAGGATARHPPARGQSALWFLSRLAPDSGADNIAVAVRLGGQLEGAALKSAFQAIVDRHGALRTTFEEIDGQPMARVHRRLAVDFERIDAAGLDERSADDLLADEASRAFDLSAGPLLRVRLLARGPRQHLLLVAVHHIVADGWSLALIAAELGDSYAAAAGEKIERPATRWRYSDYVEWQRRRLAGEEGERLWSYWSGQLSGMADIDLPTDRPRPAVVTDRGASRYRELDAATRRGIEHLAGAQGTSLYTALLSAFQVLLLRHCGEEDLAVGSPVACRGVREFADVVGYFVNTVVLRGDLRGDPTFRELLARNRRRVLEALSHQDYPLDLLAARLAPQRDLSRSPLFQVMFSLQEIPLAGWEGLAALSLGRGGVKLELAGLDVESHELEERTAQFDLALTAARLDERLGLRLRYRRDLFDDATAARLLQRLSTLLAAVVTDPDQRLAEMPLLTPAERHQLVGEWNQTFAERPGLSLHGLFEAQAGRTPEATALVWGDEQLSYATLGQRVAEVAAALRRYGVGPGVLVGVYLERSSRMVQAVLGILEAGGAYLPLDPAYPRERLAFILGDAGVSVLVTDRRSPEGLPAHSARTLCLEEVPPRRGAEREPAAVPAGQQPAYVLYTSGSTGRPKGVVIPHSAVVNFLSSMAREPGLGSDDVLLAVTTLSFDIAALELFLPLAVGGRVVVASRQEAVDGRALDARLSRSRATVMQATPSTWRLLLQAGWQPRPGFKALCGGEALPPELAEEVIARGASLWNLYGPTETTIWSMVAPVVGGEEPIAIGRPIANTRIHLLDRRLRTAPTGAAGELFIGGDGLAHGYLARPALTAERFVADPFAEVPGRRLYRTGDLARQRPDGTVDYLGRLDHQVKVRGFRIELGEVESALVKHPAVRQAVVVARRDASGESLLVAFTVPRERSAAAGELRRFLERSLPDFMVPTAFMELAELPLTANGKVDRKALPDLAAVRAASAATVAPRTPAEELLAGIWAGLLEVPEVGVEDNFFELGGHSLLATQAVARIREAFGVELPVRKVFESPTVAGLSQALSGGSPAETLRIERLPRDRELPLSFAQQRLWFLDQLESGSAFYNIAAAVRMLGRLDVAALEGALRRVVGRHEPLRTRFMKVGGRPAQVVEPEVSLNLPEVDLSALPEPVRGRELSRVAAVEAGRPFDLKRAPLLRMRLLRLGPRHQVLVLSMHHIVSDGWSMGILVREAAVLYRALRAAERSSIAELPVQYADFAHWQRRWLSGEVLEEQLAYWRRQLSGVPVLELPTDRPRPSAQSYRGASRSVALPPGLSGAISEVGRRCSATRFMVLLAGLQILLCRYCGRSDVAVGSPIAGRRYRQTEDLIGFFANTLVLRHEIREEKTFSELLAGVRELCLEAYAHQDVPFEKLVEELQPERDLAHTPLFQVAFALQPSLPALELEGLDVSQLEVDTGTSIFDLTLQVVEAEETLRGVWEYRTDLFDASTVERMGRHFGVLLKAASTDPARRLWELPLLTPAELSQTVLEWNDSAASYPLSGSLGELVAAQAERTPEAVALVFGAGHLSFRQLNARAGRLAGHLGRLGVGPEVRVGVLMERSLEMVVALLGIVKAGGAYVPLDPDYPAGRLALMLEDFSSDLAAPVVLIQERLSGRLPPSAGGEGVRVIAVDRDWGSIASGEDRSPPCRVRDDSPAYVIYTSGSTGRPKAVVNTHRAIRNRLVWMREAYRLGFDDRVLQKTPFSFDVSVWELFWPLLCGTSLVIARPGGHRDSAYLADLIVRERVTLLHFVPSMLQVFLEDPSAERCRDLRYVICSGEALPFDLTQRFFARLDGELHNLYGPTEAAVEVTFHPCERAGQRRIVPIGRPIDNLRIHLLDRRMRPVPAGVAGELHIGGVGLARGYLGRPALTAEKFVPDPLAAAPGKRLYKSGDLARHLRSGAIDYLGRLDHQVKIRGLRIELGEIEAVLGQHPAVREAVVLAPADERGGRRLVAYCVPDQSEAPLGDAGPAGPPRNPLELRFPEGFDPRALVGELRRHAGETLPDYMVPAHFAFLNELPLTASGKLDRRALPEPEQPAQSARYVAPRDPTERRLAALWADLLELERVGVEDNFFELGGHSLLAVQLLSRVRGGWGRELPVRTLFEAPTVSAFAEHLAAAGEESPLPDLTPVPRQGDFPLSFAQERLWFLDEFERGSAALNLPVSFALRGVLEPVALRWAIGELVRRHEVLRTSFTSVGGRPRQRFSASPPVAWPIVDLSRLSDPLRRLEARRLEGELTATVFDLALGPLLAVRVLRLTEREHRLLICLHHIVADGWSIGVLVRELAALYEAARRGQASPLPTLPVQYADYAHWQRQPLWRERLAAQMDYWRRQLEGAAQVLDLPTDRLRPAVQTFRGAQRGASIPPPVVQGLRRLGEQRGSTLFMTLLAAFKVLLHRWTGQDDVVVGSPIAGRSHSDLEPLIGLFLNSLVLRTDLGGDPSFGRLLERVRETAVGAFSHQDVPFEMLLQELRPERDLSRTPLFQVFFNMLNFPLQESRVGGLEVTAEAAVDLPSKFDLTVYLAERGETIRIELLWNADLFDEATMAQLLDQYGALLGQVVEDPDKRIGAYDLAAVSPPDLLPDPRRELSGAWHGAMHEVFARQAELHPHRVAVTDPHGCWTYRQVEANGNRIARYLVAGGVGRQEVVAIYAHRSAPLVWSVLGVLKAGAAFLVLDPAYPAARLVDFLRLAAPKGWIQLASAGAPPPAVERHLDALPDCVRLILAADSAAAGGPLAACPETAPGVEVGPEDAAVVGFTSGSSGRPKGIVGRQGSLSHFIPWQRREFELGAADRFAMLSALAHDPLQRDLFTPLQLGATLCIPDPEEMGTPGWLAGWLRREGVSVAHLTPAMSQFLTDGAEGIEVPSLRRVFLVGDVLTRNDVQRLRGLAPSLTCVNLFGSTETQRAVGYFPVPPEGAAAAGAEAGKQVLPLGRGMEDVQLLVLNRSGGLAGVGELGEICVRSPHLARGYLDDPELTCERFVVNPWTGLAGDRLYRTGDLGRYRHDGCVSFAGRADLQVKIRGFRIELGEVQATLAEHPAVREAVVTLRRDAHWPGGDYLAAYYVAEPGREDDAEALRSHLRQRLPDYMVPAAFVRLAEMPLTPNRKIDRRALPAPPAPRGGTGRAPQSAVEATLATLWAEVLGVGQLGVDDNFFDLGGHSLLATRLVSRARDALGVDLSLRALFEAPTVAGLAAVVQAMAPAAAGVESVELPQIEPDAAGRHEPFPLTDVQQAYWIGRSTAFELGGVSTHSYSELDAKGLDIGRLEKAWQQLIARHDMLRAIVREDGQQQILPQVPLYRIEVLDLVGAPPERAAEKLAEVRQRMSHQVLPSDRWPLFEVRASRLDAERVRLHFSLDLLIGDAMSFRILESELVELYLAPDAAPAARVPELSFRDYVLALEGLGDSALYRRALDYWRQRLTGLPPGPALPLAKPPEAVEATRFERRAGGLEPPLWERLKRRGHAAGLTPSVVLLAAFAEILRCWSKDPQFTLNLTLFNRLPLHPQVNEIVGDFTTVTLLAVDGRGSGPFEERARQLQRQLWSDLDHRYVSGVKVLREARREGSGPTLLPVVFTSTLGLPQQAARNALEVWDAEVSYSVSQTPQVWLDHQASERGGALEVTWDAVEELFPPGLMDDAFAAYQSLLERLATGEDAWRDEGETPVPESHLRQQAEVNATDAPVPAGLLHERFLKRSVRQPQRPAVISSRRRLSYGELAARAADLAHALRRRGVRPNTLVGVVMEKGWEQVAAVIGILEAGAAYLPIDPGLPGERLTYLLEHGRVETALTQSWLDRELDWPDGVERISVDLRALPETAEPPPCPAAPGDLAYVIFTSGSTGLPKGVMIDHRGALNTVVDVNRRFSVEADDRVLGLSALNFDLSVWDIFGLLSAGGAIVLPEPAAARDPGRWLGLIAEEEVTLWNTVPALMEMLTEYTAARGDSGLSPLRLVMMSGDWIPVGLPEAIRELLPTAQIISLGGATEASIWSILYPIGEVEASWKSIPYGRAMVNQSFHVLDEDLRPRPVWVPGQLYIGGIGVALGYWRDEEKTRTSFITHPVTGERLYRTGDNGRFLPDGNIEFLGRDDLQVKIQGYRIELGEVEAALAQHPEVHAAVAIAVGERNRRRLVACVVPEGAEEAAAAEAPVAEKPASADEIERHLENLDRKLRQPGLRRDRGILSLQLDKPAAGAELAASYQRRRSVRSFGGEPVPLDRFNRLLTQLMQVEIEGRALPKYRYPSAGSLYPVQTYLAIKPGRVQGIAGGFYYYHPRDHRLVLLADAADFDRELHLEVNRAIFDRSAFSIFLIGELDAIAPTYGEAARDFCLLEAGYLSQLLMTAAPDSDLGLCPIGKLDFEPLRSRFGLGDSQILLHSLLGGPAGDGRGESAALGERLRTFLEGKLPRYMVPSSFVFLESLPLTGNGKVDRKELSRLADRPRPAAEAPAPDEPAAVEAPAVSALAASPASALPHSEVEGLLGEILRDVLEVENVGLHDNFFELGGTSLHIVRAHARLRETFGREIPVIEMFNHPTISSLAGRIAAGAEDPAAAVRDEGRERQQAVGKSRLKQMLGQRGGGRRGSGDV